MSVFKTFYIEPNWYGVINLYNNELMIGTSSKPELYGSEVNEEFLREFFSKFRVLGLDRNFDWDLDVPKEWKLVDVEIKVIENIKKSSNFVDEWFSKFGEWKLIEGGEVEKIHSTIKDNDLEPIEKGNSLHVWEETYIIGEDSVRLIGAIGSKEFQIERKVK